jgi:RNA polymerase sigma-70 factor, ECF subfamily
MSAEGKFLENEVQIIERAKKDEQAFRELYDFYFPRVFGFVMKRTGDRVLTEDIVSETFLKAFTKLENYQHQGFSFGAWLYKIASNLIIDHYRKIKSREVYDLTENAGMAEKSGEYSDFERKQEIEKHLACLNERERQAIELKFFGGLANPEIAEVIGVSVGNIGVIICRALENLRKNSPQTYV